MGSPKPTENFGFQKFYSYILSGVEKSHNSRYDYFSNPSKNGKMSPEN